jgi:chromosome segregation ATPase
VGRIENVGMNTKHLILIAGLLGDPRLSQTSGPDSEVQKRILDELRAIHQDLRSTTTLQLLLAELQITQTSLDRASERRDRLKEQDAHLQIERMSAKAEVDRFQGAMDKVAKPDQDFVDRLHQLQDELRKVTAEEAAIQEQLRDAESRLRTAQADRDNVQSQLSDLVKRLSANK